MFPNVGFKPFIAFLKTISQHVGSKLLWAKQKNISGGDKLENNWGFLVVLVYQYRCVCVCEGLVPVSCWAVASLCSISCLSALWAVTGPAGGDLDVEGGGTPALL